eukprot:NODE_12500_length_508_cov_105.496104_g12210_i0.p1 GENE.NODE_12500_length_508_cov_105.496104_g12210_i0~~NODE_12500_length_508_cov_105.496104_g12210_i0.p1  ORF type:complete len:112 (-),score=19.36 NODE_12500_length_508_cov_105.496104_g12210_i0:171-458(-)
MDYGTTTGQLGSLWRAAPQSKDIKPAGKPMARNVAAQGSVRFPGAENNLQLDYTTSSGMMGNDRHNPPPALRSGGIMPVGMHYGMGSTCLEVPIR